jgi:hypothetical protein
LTNTGACLSNVPTENEEPNKKYLDQFPLPGAQIWNADDQCVRLYGVNARFCRVFLTLYYKFNFELNLLSLLRHYQMKYVTSYTVNMITHVHVIILALITH